MNKTDIREFAGRHWREVSSSDRQYWASRYRDSGFHATLNAAQNLWLHMKHVRREWPDDTLRREDLHYHIAFKKMLDGIADALSINNTVRGS